MANRSKRAKLSIAAVTAAIAYLLWPSPQAAVLAQEGMAQEQASERRQLQEMHGETNDIKSEINGAINQLNQVSRETASQQNVKEVHLFAKRAQCELMPGTTLDCLTYNGKLPGPLIRVNEGDHVRIILHNQLSVSTSLLLHGMVLPQSVSGLPRKDAGMVAPGQSYAYQFVAKQAGTFWYHPQINHSDEKMQGLAGALIVDPLSAAKTFDKDVVLVIGDLYATAGSAKSAIATTASASGTVCFHLLNGKSAPAIPAIELRQGERVRLRVINAGQQPVPLHLSGHRFEIVAVNGSDSMEPHVIRDTVTLNPSDRYDLEFAADNPGVWSLASEIDAQSTNNGKFPGGIACVVRYSDGSSSDSQQP
ncbi:MAG TPA: multicopper oxidase domain-containing protein [Trichormus sp.]|jgi:FtsP/CotA-like multicopper oxidase with cupredoxin domain